MKLLTADEMKNIDLRASNEYYIPSIILMENAGLRVVDLIEELLGDVQGKNITVIAGKGNNGGDGLVVSRHLINLGANVDTFLMGKASELTTDTLTNYKILDKISNRIYPLLNEEDLDNLLTILMRSDVVIDAIYGIGFKGNLNELDAKIVKMINWCKASVIAVDIPSGVEADTGKVHGEAVMATNTITFALPKIGMIMYSCRDYIGQLTVADISIPLALLEDNTIKNNLITNDMVKHLVLPRDPESHKGTYGHVLVVGGSIGLTGAVVLTANAALKTGVGLVTAALPESLLPNVDNQLIEVMTIPLVETGHSTIALESIPAIENMLGTSSVCAIGPGMSRYKEANAVLSAVLERSGIPLVIDADGLNALENDIEVLKNRQVPIILTPHPGEMARLTGKTIKEIQANRIEIARNCAIEWGVIIVLKGNRTVIATPDGEVYINITGNPGMATAGSGDVLCGIIAGFIAQGLNSKNAAITGVYLHGLIGDRVSESKGQRGLIAGDLIYGIPDILKQFE
ncbi:NAD(P)H-hydrate epimerase [Candidatus Syntrophocurvum alkaliphilum]|uniref:Bifunctional NAD(P)H-hydrate repair enzyme n=1 Tax=Candidatus Syntrophocurvum alkaliphilum TaxID=2293317 RepID=A0A6I6DGE5_9FIRM|nr:NAD(P)H-hydrate dehydratase [Candidatus Syntrophocurvum alkaliphilum]QGT98739.1 NAD(P)H-hydrate epimerase [Candidatus Syntrophocurvum alkaliphilum]